MGCSALWMEYVLCSLQISFIRRGVGERDTPPNHKNEAMESCNNSHFEMCLILIEFTFLFKVVWKDVAFTTIYPCVLAVYTVEDILNTSNNCFLPSMLLSIFFLSAL